MTPKNPNNKLSADVIAEFKQRNLGCCGGDLCPHYTNLGGEDDHFKNVKNHDDYLENFIRQALAKQKARMVEVLDGMKKELPIGEAIGEIRTLGYNQALSEVKKAINDI